MPEMTLFPAPRAELAERLAALARRNIWIGASSWKYPGWLGRIYTAERYQTRGRFSEKKFKDACLAEYAETFPIVCGDFTFYQFPSESYWRGIFSQTPQEFRFAFKAPEMITVKRFPSHARYGSRSGLTNESFLDASMLEDLFLAPLAAHHPRVALLIFEFGAFPKAGFAGANAFIGALDGFLSRVKRICRYAVEIRNREFLVPDYFACLRRHGVAHVFNAWTRMPELAAAIRIRDAFCTDFTVTRALLRAGRTYEQAVAQFAPYDVIRDPNPPARRAMRALIGRALGRNEAAYIFVNNRFEGNAPATIEALTAP